MLGQKHVYSHNPTPAHISGTYLDWELVEKDVQDTLTAAKRCNLDFCSRGFYTVGGDQSRLTWWVQMTRALMDA